MYCVDRLEINKYYYIKPRYYLKVDYDGVIHVLFEGESLHLNVIEFFDFRKKNRISENSNFPSINKEKEISVKDLENEGKKLEDLPLNAYLDFEVDKLKEVLKRLEELEDFEKCAKLRDIINFKEEGYGED